MKAEEEHEDNLAKINNPHSQNKDTQYKTTQESSEKIRSVKKVKAEPKVEEEEKTIEKKVTNPQSPTKTGKDNIEFVFNDEGKRIGKRDAQGNFVPYKKRGRPQKGEAAVSD